MNLFTPTRQWSHYQEAVFDFIANGTGNALVDAKAGSGKTSTILEAVSRIPASKSCLLVAFNRHIAQTLQARIRRPRVSCMTLNSFGYSLLRNALPGVAVNEKKTERLLMSTYDMGIEANYAEFRYIRNAVEALVSLVKSNYLIAPDERDLMDLVDNYDIEIDSEALSTVFHKTLEVYKQGLVETHCIDFDDQVFLPVYMNLATPPLDFVFVDEVQDLSPVQMELVLKAGESGRVICVGDYNQAVYGFRGAHPDAVGEVTRRLDATVLPLSISYRCPSEIVKVAREQVPALEWDREGGSVEEVPTHRFLAEVAPGDMILCRFTAPLMGLSLDLLSQGRKACVLGRDIEQGLMKLVKRFDRYPTQSSRTDAFQAFWLRLDTYLQDASVRYADKPMKYLAVEDRCMALRAIGGRCTSLWQLTETLKHLFSDKGPETITLSTVHRAKGLEADRVWIVKPECLPYEARAQQPWQRQQERNLRYVAVTRSKEQLFFVVDKEVSHANQR